MKKTFLLFCLVLGCFYLTFAQDTIILRTGDIIIAKVTKIKIVDMGEKKIKYKKNSDTINGSTYTESSNNVSGIKYKNGQIEIYDSFSLSTYYKNLTKKRLLQKEMQDSLNKVMEKKYQELKKQKEKIKSDSIQKAKKDSIEKAEKEKTQIELQKQKEEQEKMDKGIEDTKRKQDSIQNTSNKDIKNNEKENKKLQNSSNNQQQQNDNKPQWLLDSLKSYKNKLFKQTQENKKIIEFCDSLIQVTQNKLDSLQKYSKIINKNESKNVLPANNSAASTNKVEPLIINKKDSIVKTENKTIPKDTIISQPQLIKQSDNVIKKDTSTQQINQNKNILYDIILLRKGDNIKAKIEEINSTEIKYKKFENLNGPSYSILISDVFMIKYPNGSKDVFNKP